MITPLVGGLIALSGVQLFHILVTIGLLKQYNALHELVNDNGIARHRLMSGSAAPPVQLTDLRSGKLYDHARDADAQGSVLLFLSPRCAFCANIVRELAKFSSGELSRLVPICLGVERDCAQLLAHLADGVPALSDSTHAVGRRYGITNAPEAVLITPLGKIRGYSYPRTGTDVLGLLKDSGLDYEVEEVGIEGNQPETQGFLDESVRMAMAGDNGRA